MEDDRLERLGLGCLAFPQGIGGGGTVDEQCSQREDEQHARQYAPEGAAFAVGFLQVSVKFSVAGVH